MVVRAPGFPDGPNKSVDKTLGSVSISTGALERVFQDIDPHTRDTLQRSRARL
jgi:hypothetical protein